ncbi:non-ribosomal peptide synthetase [Streptomyces exfoliatus]|uniref:non-ribosomal peptide synthetase n=1 Tax=Streptomyces exfoliatus TaxID=1905 RepID=UPI0004CB3E41|nr:non-ribosomal peptide synthetase [Streptomyces exfoliatus]
MSRPQPFTRRSARDRAPLSHAQAAIWRAEQVRPGTALHNETAAFRLTGPLDVAALEQALADLAVRHEVMRCSVAADESGMPWQHFAERVGSTVVLEDLSALPRGERPERLAGRMAEAAAVPFDLGSPPLLRTHLFRLGEAEHLLMFVAHHIVVDAWAFGVFLEALADRYTVRTTGSGSADESEARNAVAEVDFGDYAVWQRAGDATRGGLDHWRERLGGELPVLALPTDQPRADRTDVSGAVHRVSLPPDLVTRLSALGRGERATLPTVLLTAFCAVVQRFTGQDDLIVGMPVATRNLPRLSSVIGPLLNVMAHRADLSGEPTFRAALQRTRLALKADLAHRDTPFDTVVTDLGRASGPGRGPLFQVMYAFHSGPTTALELPGLETVPALSHSGTAKYDMSLFLRPRPSGELELDLEYRTGLFGAQSAAEFADALLCLVGAAAEEPDRPLAELPVMTARQRRRVLTGFNSDDAATTPWGTVDEAVRLRAAVDGGAPAVRQGATVLDYTALDTCADRIADALGAVADERIAVRVRRTAHLVPLLLGIWRAGAAFVPLDEGLPTERAAHMLHDSGACLLVTDDPADEAWGVPTVSLAALLAADAAPAATAGPPGAAPDGIAYLMYTSGSTGTPKGVAVPHSCVANLLHSVTLQPGIGPEDVLVAVTSLSFDISVLELFAPLTAGGQVVVAPRESVRDTDALGALLRTSGATVMQATPSLWTALVSGGWPGLPGLRALSGGEALPQNLAERLLELTDEVWNLYGPTETTIWSTVARILPGEQVTVGRPVARTVCYVLDRDGRPVPRGATGELVIGGAGVTAGYWRRPDLTSSAFGPDPVDPTGGTVYRTGDLARHLPDGRICVVGRADQQVKILGHRVELGETEQYLGDHPSVGQAVVVMDREHQPGPRLVAFVTAAARPPAGTRDGGGIDPAELRRHLAARLPAAAIPSAFVCLPELPLNTSGKVDRPALARAAGEVGASTAGRSAPVTAAEQRIAAVWADVLALPVASVGLDDDFLAAGGNSISATRLLARLASDLGSAPTLAEFYADPVLRTLAAQDSGTPPPAPPQVRYGTAGPVVPLTDQQRQLWLLHRLDEDSAAYNLAARLTLPDAPDEAALTAALADLVDRHQVLSARCELRDGTPVMVYEPAAPVPLDVVDLRGAEGADARSLAQLAEAEAVRPFDLATGPLLRATLVRTAADGATLLVTAHHIAVDGWSISIAVGDLAAFYSARRYGTAAPEPLPAGFREYAADQAGPSAQASRAEHLAYWTERLAGHSGVLELPADLGRPAARATEGAALPVRLPQELAARLRETASAARTTPFTVLLAAFAALLGRYADTDDVVVGVPVAGRGPAELDQVVGCFTNTLPVRIDLSGSPSFTELVTRTGRSLAADLDHPLVPFDRLVSALELPRDPARPPLAQAMLVFQNTPVAAAGPGGVLGTLAPTGTRTAKYDLTLSLTDGPLALEGELEYASTRFSRGQAGRFADHFHLVLRAALAEPGASLDGLDLSEAVAGPVVSGPGRADHPVPVHEVFRRQAAAAPGAVAVRHGAEEIGYGALDGWSDRIAARLRGLGAGPGRFVSVLLPTGIVQTAAILGIAKTGAAFAVLDGSDPSLRLHTVLTDAEPLCVLAAQDVVAGHPTLLDRDAARFGGFPLEFLDPALPSAGEETAPERTTADSGMVPGATADDPLCLVYTSGSTGLPKGIALPQATLAQFADWQRREFGARSGSRIAQWAPFTYDAAYTEVFAALCSGATLCVPPDGVRRDPVEMARWLREERITQIQLVPAFFQLVAEVLEAQGADLPDLEHLLLAGEVLPVALAHDWAHRPVRPRIHNLYGPTECVLATHRELLPGEEFAASVPIGKPIPGRSAVVLDSKGRTCPVGVTGEIHLRSEFLAGGYHRRPEESRAAYVPDPREPGATLYRTGDLGRLLPEGGLAFAGRLGSQIKIRGNRVELEEIEAVLEAHPQVREAAAAVHRIGGTQRLTAYAVAAEGVTASALRTHLAERLPAAAVPESVRLLEALPRTRTNKRDRARLPLPEAPEADLTGGAPALSGPEQTIADAWRELLGTEAIGRHVNFFEAGGDSMLAAKLQIELTRRLGRPVRLVDVFARPTIAEFAAALGALEVTDTVGVPEAAQQRSDRRRAALNGRARARRAARDAG